MHELEVDKSEFDKDPAKLGVLFGEMIQMCLWFVYPAWTDLVTIMTYYLTIKGAMPLYAESLSSRWAFLTFSKGSINAHSPITR